MDRKQAEAAAQRARAKALKHLQETGSGPSHKELQEQRQWQAARNTQAKAGVQTPDPMMQQRDNTLEALARQRGRRKEEVEEDRGSVVGQTGSVGTTDLPEGWKQAVDPTSGDVYYWNDVTKETSWEHPQETKEEEEDASSLPKEWEAIYDSSSGEYYYWNRRTNETTWTRPEKPAVSYEQALESRSRLDAILEACEKASVATDKDDNRKRRREDSDAKESGNDKAVRYDS